MDVRLKIEVGRNLSGPWVFVTHVFSNGTRDFRTSATRPPCVSNDPGCLPSRSEGGTRARRPSCKLLHTTKTRRSANTREGTRTYNSDDSEKKRGRAFWFTSAI